MIESEQKIDGLEAALCEVLSAQVEILRRENLTLRAKNAEMTTALTEKMRGYDAVSDAVNSTEPVAQCTCLDCWCHSVGETPDRSRWARGNDTLGIVLLVTVALLLLNFLGCFRVAEDTDMVGADEAYHRAQGRVDL